jgi:manganese efflux pump family protein
MTAFEGAMPVVGLLLGHALGTAIGGAARWCAVALLAAVGIWLLFGPEEDAPDAGVRGVALLAVGLSISLDELAMGFSIGLLHLSLALAVVLIAAQAFAVSQLGLALGARVGERVREGAERLAGVALVGLAVLFAVT